MTSGVSGSNVSILFAKENPTLVTWQRERRDGKGTEVSGRYAQHAPRHGTLWHIHMNTHPYTNNQNKQTIAARGQFSLLHSPLHRQMRSWPPTDNLPPCPLHRCITSPQSSNCQAWSFQYTSLPHHGHGAGQAECVAPLINWVNNWWKLTLVIWPLNHSKQPNMGRSWWPGD